MFPSPGPSSGTAQSPSVAPLPPLPDLSGSSGKGPTGGKDDPLSSMMSGLAPLKKGMDKMLEGLRDIEKTGMLVGSERTLGVIRALIAQLLPQAIQQSMIPGEQSQGLPPTIGQGMPQPPPGV